MFSAFSRSWQLMKGSYRVLQMDRELVIFPILSCFFGLLAFLTFILPLFLVQNFAGALFYPLLFLFYFVTSFITIFFSSALIGAATIRLKGGDPTVRDGINIALANLPNIAAWALVSATVGVILRALQSRGLLGRIIAGLVGGAWSIITFFVIPVLVLEKVGPLEAVKRSTDIVKQRFGEMVIGSLGIGVAAIPLYFGAIIAGVILTLLLMAISPGAGLLIGICITVLLLVGISMFVSALNAIFVAALYHYASTGKEPENWKIGEIIEGAKASAAKKKPI